MASKGRERLSELSSSSLHQIEVSISLPPEIHKAVPRWIHFTPGNSSLSVRVRDRLTGRRTGEQRRHKTFKPPSNNDFVISQQTATLSQSQLLPLSNFISLALSLALPLPSCLIFPPQTSSLPPSSHSISPLISISDS